MAPHDEELTPERLAAWNQHVAALEQATSEIERRSAALVSGMAQHYRKTPTAADPKAGGCERQGEVVGAPAAQVDARTTGAN